MDIPNEAVNTISHNANGRGAQVTVNLPNDLRPGKYVSSTIHMIWVLGVLTWREQVLIPTAGGGVKSVALEGGMYLRIPSIEDEVSRRWTGNQ